MKLKFAALVKFSMPTTLEAIEQDQLSTTDQGRRRDPWLSHSGAQMRARTNSLGSRLVEVRKLAAEGNVAALRERLQDMTESGSLTVRGAAAVSLGDMRESSAVPALIDLLADDHEGTRIAAAKALGQIGNDKASPALIRSLADPSPGVRASAAWSLGELTASDAVPELVRAFSADEWLVRRCAAEALGQIGDRTVEPDLAQAARREGLLRRRHLRQALATLRSNAE